MTRREVERLASIFKWQPEFERLMHDFNKGDFGWKMELFGERTSIEDGDLCVLPIIEVRKNR